MEYSRKKNFDAAHVQKNARHAMAGERESGELLMIRL
jgi:hypothetical protein